ncbi:MAG: hypothetical protein AB1431_20290 [Pseudomonadota bacterium]
MTDAALRFDLAAALPAIVAAGAYPALAEAIRRACSAASAHEDLRAARDALILLRRFTKEEGFGTDFSEAEHDTMVGTLFSHAVLLYARATETKPIKGERDFWFGRSKLTQNQRAIHQEAMDLRNTAIAHFGKAATLPDGALVREALVMRPIAGGTHFAFFAARRQNRAHFAADLLALTETVQDLAFAAVQARYAEIGAAVRAAAEARDPLLIDILRRFPFSGADFFPRTDWQGQMDAMEDDPRPVIYTSTMKPDRTPDNGSDAS